MHAQLRKVAKANVGVDAREIRSWMPIGDENSHVMWGRMSHEERESCEVERRERERIVRDRMMRENRKR